jgi:2-oxoisovalerate dehydrogenase E1 component alpha subunit
MNERNRLQINKFWTNDIKSVKSSKTIGFDEQCENKKSNSWVSMIDNNETISEANEPEETSGAFERAIASAGEKSPKVPNNRRSKKNKGTNKASLTNDNLVAMYRRMVLCRTLDERIWMLNRQGKAAIMASAQGHEAGQIGSVAALRKGYDQFYIYYRDFAVLLELGLTPTDIIKGFTAKLGEPLSGARQFPTHGAHPEFGIINLSNVVATQIPQAVGSALASKMKGEDRISVAYFGDGAASTGDCHEAMNFAAIHKLPVIFFCENNKYAISVHLSKQMAVDNISLRAQGYGIPGISIDGCDINAVYEATSQAAIRARAGKGPTFIEADVERYLPHTSDDDDSIYRGPEEIKQAKTRDPVKTLKDQLMSMNLIDQQQDQSIFDEAKNIVNEATDEAEKTPYPGTSEFGSHVYG